MGLESWVKRIMPEYLFPRKRLFNGPFWEFVKFLIKARVSKNFLYLHTLALG